MLVFKLRALRVVLFAVRNIDADYLCATFPISSMSLSFISCFKTVSTLHAVHYSLLKDPLIISRLTAVWTACVALDSLSFRWSVSVRHVDGNASRGGLLCTTSCFSGLTITVSLS